MKHINRIIFYNVADLMFSSFYLRGLLQNRHRFNYKLSVSSTVPPFIYDGMPAGEWSKIFPSICLFEARIASGDFYFCIDAHDSARTKSGGYHIPLLEKVRYYFKVNYRLDAINKDDMLYRFREKIMPASPFFPVAIPWYFRLLPGLSPFKESRLGLRKILKTAKQQISLVSLDKFRRLRQEKRDLDVFFVMKYYGRHSEIDETRYGIMRELKKSHGINSVAGLTRGKEFPEKYKRDQLAPFKQKVYLSNLSRSKIGIYVRGPHDCISLKFGELMALGKPIVGQKILNNQNFFYENKYIDEQFAFETPEEIVQRVAKLLARPDRLIKLGQANAHLFDKLFTPRRAVADIIEHMVRNE